MTNLQIKLSATLKNGTMNKTLKTSNQLNLSK